MSGLDFLSFRSCKNQCFCFLLLFVSLEQPLNLFPSEQGKKNEISLIPTSVPYIRQECSIKCNSENQSSLLNGSGIYPLNQRKPHWDNQHTPWQQENPKMIPQLIKVFSNRDMSFFCLSPLGGDFSTAYLESKRECFLSF